MPFRLRIDNAQRHCFPCGGGWRNCIPNLGATVLEMATCAEKGPVHLDVTWEIKQHLLGIKLQAYNVATLLWIVRTIVETLCCAVKRMSHGYKINCKCLYALLMKRI